METIDRVAEIKALYGEKVNVSDWIEVRQEDMNTFGASTHDIDWMHTDPERALRESPFGGTVAYGFWTMSMLSAFTRETAGAMVPEGAIHSFNYGFDKVRLMAPAPVGSRVRNHSRLLDVIDKGNGRYVVKTDNRVEIEGESKPAMIAEWLFMLVYPPGA